MRRTSLLMLALVGATLFALGCHSSEIAETNFELPENFSCASALPGWERATAVTPDVVPPCMTGSSGSCGGVGLVYVSGTGWCRPR